MGIVKLKGLCYNLVQDCNWIFQTCIILMKKKEFNMAKQQVYQLDNGAVIIYQKQGTFNGYSFQIGFLSGGQLDGKYKGLSHLLEHLMFRSSSSKSMKKNVTNDILKYSINQNAETTQYYISSTFSTTADNVASALENNVKMFTGKYFTEEQIKREIEIVKQEINMYADSLADQIPTAYDALIDGLKIKKEEPLDLLGNGRTLNQITPAILKRYIERYFTTNNLIISVTSNQSAEKAIELINEHFISKIPMAKSDKYVIDYPELDEFGEVNALCLLPNPNRQNVEIDLLLRERTGYSQDPDKELANDIIEEYMMNCIGGILWNVLREDNNLVYIYSLSNQDFGPAKFKNFKQGENEKNN